VVAVLHALEEATDRLRLFHQHTATLPQRLMLCI
jgi:hypothetical protein